MASPSQQEARVAKALRDLRESEFPGAELTQAKLARALSAEGSVAGPTLSSWESQNNPKLPTEARLRAYARFFATKRSLTPEPHLIPLNELDAAELSRYHKLESQLLSLLDTAESPMVAEVAERNTWRFLDRGPATIICPVAPDGARGPWASTSEPNYTTLHQYADLDALIELFGHLRAQNPAMGVYHRLSNEQLSADDLSGHLIALGGIGLNPLTRRVLAGARDMPIAQISVPELKSGEIFTVSALKNRRFFPVFEDLGDGEELMEDVALLARMPNPFNRSKTLTICNGIHSRGVLGAVRALTDARVRDLNEEYLAGRFLDGRFALLLRVPVVQGSALTPDISNPENRLYEWPPEENKS